METLGGATFIRSGETFDYNYLETIKCLSELCDLVAVCVVDSGDDTIKKISELPFKNVVVIECDDSQWQNEKGREKLSYFSNVAIEYLQRHRMNWVVYVQADEVLHEDSFSVIREAIEDDSVDAYMVRRYNLWRDTKSILNVEHGRKPCSTEVIRLAKTKARCVGDAESMSIDGGLSFTYLSKIEIFHMGFVRKREVMKHKIINMQENIFQVDHDKRLDESEIFEPMRYFAESDLVPLHKPLPKFITEWASVRP